jgi:hypothetical protein
VNVTHYVLDRVEDGSWAVLENPQGLTFRIPLGWLPSAISEGDVLAVEHERIPPEGGEGVPGEHGIRFRIDPQATRKRADEAAARRATLRKAPGGDVEL